MHHREKKIDLFFEDGHRSTLTATRRLSLLQSFLLSGKADPPTGTQNRTKKKHAHKNEKEEEYKNENSLEVVTFEQLSLASKLH